MEMNANNYLKGFFMLHFKTKILEACQWDEDLADNVVGLLEYELSCVRSRDVDEIVFEVYEGLAEEYDIRICDAVSDVLYESLSAAPFLLEKDNSPRYIN